MQNTRKVILFVAIALLMFSLSILFGARKVKSMIPGSAEEKVLDAAEYTEGASFDAFLVKDGRLYDVYSLTPELLQAKDCPT